MTLSVGPLQWSSVKMRKLTADQLRQAARDLIDAAGEVAARGHHKGALVDHTTGAVCIVGAIEVVTYKTVRREQGDYRLFGVVTDNTDRIYRAENATIVLADSVSHLCECNKGEAAWQQVEHYNDAHCPGGIVAYNIMRIAAARALVLAESPRET